jgi:DHA1 family inner membrane transport protein
MCALAALAFAAVVVEFVPVGALDAITADLDAPAAAAGAPTSAFAIGLAVLTLPTTLVLRVTDRTLLALGAALLAAGTAAGAMSGSLEALVVTRAVAGWGLGLVWTAIGGIQARSVAEALLPRAVALSGAAIALALAGGVPLAAVCADLLGWRTAMVAAAGAVLACGIWALAAAARHEAVAHLPATAAASRSHVRDALRVAALCVAIVAVMTAQYLNYTFVDRVTGGDSTGILVAFGVGAAVAVSVVAVWPRRPRAFAGVALAILAVSLASFAIRPADLVGALVWGAGFGALPSLLQSLALRGAGATAQRVSATTAVCFQVGIAAGSGAGGGLTTAVSAMAGAALCAVAVVPVLVAARRPEAASVPRATLEAREPPTASS